MTDTTSTLANRITLALIGALAGLAAWALLDWLPDVIDNERLLLALIAAGLGFFAVLLALLGPARPVAAAGAAAVLVLPATGLLVWASLRFADLKAFLDQPHSIVAFVLMLSIATPFVASALESPGGWRRYERLFDISWTIVVRYVAAWLFVGVAWAVLVLSNELFQLVGLEIIEDLIDLEWFPYVFSGLVLGLALAVVYELREYVSPFLIIKLLHLLVPVALVVIVVFVVALPVRGLGEMFGGLSAAAVLVAVTFGAITLITTAIDKADDVAVEAGWMRRVTQGVAVLLPVTAGLAVYAVALRVAQYGWTPDRIAAALAAGIVGVYAIFYAVAVLMQARWMARIRGANLWLAMGVAGLAALWLTPVLNAERISTASQLARFEAGRADAQTLAIWEMTHDWGVAGAAGIARLRASEDAEVAKRIAAAEGATNRWQFDRGHTPPDRLEKSAELASLIAVRPEGRVLPEGAFDGYGDWMLDRMLNGCRSKLPDGRAGCVLIFGDFGPGDSAIGLFHRGAPEGFVLENGRLEHTGEVAGRDVIGAREIMQVLDGAYDIAPSKRNALHVDGAEFIVNN